MSRVCNMSKQTRESNCVMLQRNKVSPIAHSYVETLLPVVGECECLKERQPGTSNGGHRGYTVLVKSQLTKKNMRWEGGDLWERACVRVDGGRSGQTKCANV